ncbi:MAG: 23S rRNA (adenine(2503)-C(2))-methyltransferase RlmN [Hyphomicrobiales bacterium]
MEKIALFGLTLTDLQEVCKDLKLPKFVAKQISDWLYKKNITSIDEMTNLSKKARELLNEKYTFGVHAPIKAQESTDGTKKYLYQAPNRNFIETVYIPDKERATLCVSSQVGCKMGCLFCVTGKQGFQAQLTPGEIVNQIRSLPEREKLTNIVYMGMGEPFDNLDNVMKSLEILTSDYGFEMSPRRITVSSIGITPALQTFLKDSNCHLAISLHTPFEDERRKLMPVENVYNLPEIMDVIRKHDFGLQRRVSFEYIMFKGVNDTPAHIKQMCKLLNGLRCRVNLIKFHAFDGSPLEGSDRQTIEYFSNKLNEKGIRSTIRASRGEDILAACGLLSTKELVKRKDIED